MAEESYKVTLNAYDLSQGMARQLSTSFLGKTIEAIWHTGIVVYGHEYYFGGGIQNCPAGRSPYGTPMRVIDLGETQVPKDLFETYLGEISPRYTAETYSLLTHNCNNFSNEVAQFLVGKGIPEDIINLPNEVMNSPMGALIMPMIQQLEATLRANAVPQAPQFRPSTVANAVAKSTTDKKAVKDVVGPTAKVEGDPLGDARGKIQEEITKEFATLMATGTLRASEAAALATKRVMQRYGNSNVAQ